MRNESPRGRSFVSGTAADIVAGRALRLHRYSSELGCTRDAGSGICVVAVPVPAVVAVSGSRRTKIGAAQVGGQHASQGRCINLLVTNKWASVVRQEMAGFAIRVQRDSGVSAKRASRRVPRTSRRTKKETVARRSPWWMPDAR
jgi:hypothetical protein